MSHELDHQGFQGFPQFNARIVDENGQLQIPWDRFLLTLWEKLGANNDKNNSWYLVFSAPFMHAVNVQTGEQILLQSAGDVAALQAEIDVLNGQVGVLQGQVGALAGQVAALAAADVEQLGMIWALRRRR